MSELSGKDKRALRSRGQTLEACVSLGHQGMSEKILALIAVEFEQSELIKVRLGDETGRDRKEAAKLLAEKTGSEVAGVTGRSVLLFKESIKKATD